MTLSGASVRHAQRSVTSLAVSRRIHSGARRLMTPPAERSMPHSEDEQIITSRNGDRFALRPLDCPTCGEQPKRLLGRRGGPSQRYGLGVETRIVQCERCSLVFPDPFPFPLDAARLYADPEKYFAAHDEAAKVE